MTTRRIISLVPSLSHTVCEFGLIDEIVGCTSFCVDPPQLMKLCTSIGGTKNPDLDAIAKLKPTHILTNDEENTAPHIAACEQIAPTFRCLPKSPGDVPKLLNDLGGFLGLSDIPGAEELTHRLAALKSKPKIQKKCLYLIWRNPWMAAGVDTYISRSLEFLGWQNVLSSELGRYPTLTKEMLEGLTPDVVLLSTEPYPFRKRDRDALKEEWESAPDMLWCDGKLFSWFGSMTNELVEAMVDLDPVLITQGTLFTQR